MEFLTGDDYPWLCDACKATVNQCVELVLEGPDTDDPEAPLMLAGDLGLMCNPWGCDGPTWEEPEPQMWNFWLWRWPDQFTLRGQKESKWPNIEFAKLAGGIGFSHLVTVFVTKRDLRKQIIPPNETEGKAKKAGAAFHCCEFGSILCRNS